MTPAAVQLGEVICSTHTIDQLLDEIRVLLSDKAIQPRTILCVNAHIYNLAWSNPELREAINEARIVAMDGIGIVAALRFLGASAPDRCNMTEAFRAFLLDKTMPQTRGLLVGLTEEEGRRAAREVERNSSHCRIERTISGYLDYAEYEALFAQHTSVDFIFIGMGTPRTELLSRIAQSVCPAAIVWGIGGGTINIFAGVMKEAPPVFRRYSLQWLHRLGSDPARLWRRYIIGNPLFIYRVLTSARRQRRAQT